MNMKDGQRHPILSWWNFWVSQRNVGGTGERKRNKRTERQMDRNMIYPDLGSTLRTVKGGTRERWQ